MHPLLHQAGNSDMYALSKMKPHPVVCILDKVLETTVPIPVKDLLSVAPEFRKHLRELATTKCIPVTTNVVQVNELSGRDPDAVS